MRYIYDFILQVFRIWLCDGLRCLVGVGLLLQHRSLRMLERDDHQNIEKVGHEVREGLGRHCSLGLEMWDDTSHGISFPWETHYLQYSPMNTCKPQRGSWPYRTCV